MTEKHFLQRIIHQECMERLRRAIIRQRKLSMEAYIGRTCSHDVDSTGDQGRSIESCSRSSGKYHLQMNSRGKLILEADLINGTTNTMKGTAKLLVATELYRQTRSSGSCYVPTAT